MKKTDPTNIKDFVSKLFDSGENVPKNDFLYPKISIITPSYNQAAFIERTILSVLNQNYPNLEYIIIDGGSTDNSVEIIKKYEKHISYWVSEKDNGQSDALNKGFRRATGEIIGWQNSDDIYLTGAFFQIADRAKKSDADIFFGDVVKIDQSDNVIRKFRFVPYLMAWQLYHRMSLSNQSAFWRRKVFSDIGMIDERLGFAMDYDFFLRAANARLKFEYVAGYLGAFRMQKNAKTSTFSRNRINNEKKLLEKRYNRKSHFIMAAKLYFIAVGIIYYLRIRDFRSLPVYVYRMLFV